MRLPCRRSAGRGLAERCVLLQTEAGHQGLVGHAVADVREGRAVIQLVAGFQEEKNRLEGARALVLREFG